MKPGKKGIRRIIDATTYSSKGLKAAWLNEEAFRQEVLLAVVFIVIAFFLPVSALERTVMVASVVLVITVELLNSALEAVVDRFGGEWHELSGRAKDMGSAAVFMTLALAAFVWVSLLF